MKHQFSEITCRHAMALLAAGFCVSVTCLLHAADRPVEKEIYLTGAWFAPRNAAEREMYLKGGFTLVPYTSQCRDWAVENGLKFIGHVSSHGMPRDVARPFEDASGSQSMSVGLFTHINFNAPSVEDWWTKRVPEAVQAMPHAEHIRFWKVHNEFGYHSGKLYDYSPGSLARYRTWLQGRYADIADLNTKWGTSFADFAAVEPPREREEMLARLGNWLEWRRFTCWNFADYFHTSGELVRTVLPKAAVSDNYYTTSPMQGWDNFELARQTDYMGYDMYDATRWDRLVAKLEHVRSGAAAWDKPFVIIEYHAGPNNWITEVTRRHLTIEAFAALGRECRAIQWFRWIPGKGGREQGIHGMMHDDGTPTERFTAAAEVSAFCQRLAPLLHTSRTTSKIALLTSSDSTYLAYAKRTSIYTNRTRWDRFNAVLSAGGLQCDQIDPTVLIERDLTRYRVIIAGHVEVIPEKAMLRLRRFAADGGTVVLHPDTGLLDAYGRVAQASPYADETAPDGPWQARKRIDGQSSVIVEPVGRGRMLHCAWEMPRQQPEPEVLVAMVGTYRRLLAEHAALQPDWRAGNVAPTEDLDVRVLDSGKGLLVAATWMSEDANTVELTIPGIRKPVRAYLLSSQTAAVTPLAAELTADGLVLDPIALDPAAMVLISDQPWQPLVGVEAPKILHVGEETAVTVTVDNLGFESVSGILSLKAPEGWAVTIAGKAAFADLVSGQRASCTFRVTVPTDADTDHFAIDHPLVGNAEFSAGVSGSLSARHLPKLMPAVDLRVRYQDHDLTPWQTMSPPILRWGWDREVHIPPAPPLSIGAPCRATATLRVRPDLVGNEVELSVHGIPGVTLAPATVRLQHPKQDIEVTFMIPTSGDFELEARVGNITERVQLHAGVHTETVEAALAGPLSDLPPGWKPVAICAIGARDAGTTGMPVSFEFENVLPTPLQLRVFGPSGGSTAACIGPTSLTLAADVARDSVRRYIVARGPETSLPVQLERVHMDQTDDATVIIHGDAYSVCFDTQLGIVCWMEMGGRRIVPHRTGIVARADAGADYEPGTDGSVEGVSLAGSAVEATMEFTRRQRELEIREKWAFQAGRIDIEVRLVSRGTGPITLTSLDYELGLDPEQLPHWRSAAETGADSTGRLPSGFGPARNARVIDFTDEKGSGIALSLGRCAMITKWQNNFAGVRHHAALTAIGLFRSIRLDPGDTILAEFALIPHTTPNPDTGTPTIITTAKQTE